MYFLDIMSGNWSGTKIKYKFKIQDRIFYMTTVYQRILENI